MTVAVDIGGTSIRITRIGDDPPGIPDTVLTLPTPPDIGGIADRIIGTIADLGPTKAIGVGCAGLVDAGEGVATWMPHASGREAGIGEALMERFAVPVLVDNDANLAAFAEAQRGAGIGFRMVLMVTVGTGIGAGLVIDGRIERGRGGLGEVGHMRLAPDPRCACGLSGCWEALGSGRVLDAGAAALLGPGAGAADLVRAAAAGDGAAVAHLRTVGEWLGVGLGNLITTLDPDVIVVGGGAAEAGDALLGPASRYLEARGGGLAVAGIPPVVPAAFGPSAVLVGAAMAASALAGNVGGRDTEDTTR